MRCSSLLLAVYFMLLALIPCSDIGESFTLHVISVITGEDTSYHAHKDGHDNCDDDHCSPFCVCSCCQITIDTPSPIEIHIDEPLQIEPDQPAAIIQWVDLLTADSLFQPPRMNC